MTADDRERRVVCKLAAVDALAATPKLLDKRSLFVLPDLTKTIPMLIRPLMAAIVRPLKHHLRVQIGSTNPGLAL